MEKKLIITCQFSEFLKAYTGLDDSEDYMALIEEDNMMWFVDSQSNNVFLTETDLIAINDSLVTIQLTDQMENGNCTLNLTILTPDVNNPYNYSTVECDCVDFESILHDIITHHFRY